MNADQADLRGSEEENSSGLIRANPPNPRPSASHYSIEGELRRARKLGRELEVHAAADHSRKEGVVVRQMRKREMEAEVERFMRVYNVAWGRNWGFVPMTLHEIEHLAKQLKPVVDPELVVFAEIKSLHGKLREADGRKKAIAAARSARRAARQAGEAATRTPDPAL